MRQVVFSFIFSGLFLFVKGQEIVTKQLEINRELQLYAYFSETDLPSKTLLAFYNSDTAVWNAIKFCQELAPIAEKNGYDLVVPQISESFDISTFLNAWSIRPSKLDSTIFMVNGSSAKFASQLLHAGIPGLIVMPFDSSFQVHSEQLKPVSIITDTERYPLQDLWIDSLKRSDMWLTANDIATSHYYYIDNYYEVYDREILWLDSLSHFLNDSTARTEWLAKSGLQNEPAEVYRQGNKVELKLKMTNPEEVTVQVIDLSANVLAKSSKLYGIGMHDIAIETRDLEWGVYNIEIKGDKLIKRFKIMIRG